MVHCPLFVGKPGFWVRYNISDCEGLRGCKSVCEMLLYVEMSVRKENILRSTDGKLEGDVEKKKNLLD